MPSSKSLGKTSGQGFRMLVVTAISFCLGFLLTVAGREWLGLDEKAAYSYAILVCTLINFFACRHYVFRSGDSPLWPEALKFFPSVFAFRFLEIALFSLLSSTGLDYRVAYVATSVISLTLKFLVAKYFIFRTARR